VTTPEVFRHPPTPEDPTVTRTAARLARTAPARLVALLLVALTASVVAPLPAGAASPLTSEEQQFLGQVNGHRANAGLPALRVTADLTDAARAQSQRMASENRLYHTANLAGAVSGWLRLGENVGYGGSVAVVDDALINSPGHRANILGSAFTQVGVGVVKASTGRIWVTQIFRTPDASAANAPGPAGAPAPLAAPAPAPAIEPAAGVDPAVCPVDKVTWFRFSDMPRANAHRAAADCSAWWGLVTGKSPSTFAPTAGLTRGQLAAIVARLLEKAGDLPTATRDHYGDDNGHFHERSINALAEAGVVTGASGSFAPNAPASRAQTAAFLVRAAEVATDRTLPTGPSFADMVGSPLADEVAKAAAAGIVNGYDKVVFDGGSSLLRQHGASLTTRSLKLLVDAAEIDRP
jgi:uncharacterized protein YkwD